MFDHKLQDLNDNVYVLSADVIFNAFGSLILSAVSGSQALVRVHVTRIFPLYRQSTCNSE
jgi:hypothetical protein